jgi:hypothetical protein
MKFKIDHDYHIHSQLSSCSHDPQQTPDRILQYAKENGLSRICLTDHYWDSAVDGASQFYRPQDFDHIAKAMPLPQDEEVEFLFGCETDMDKLMTVGIPAARFDEFDFIIIPTTHLHMTGFTISNEDAESNERRAQLWVERLDALLHKSLPFGKIGLAHLVCGLIKRESREEYLNVLSLIPDAEMERLFTMAAELGCGALCFEGNIDFYGKSGFAYAREFGLRYHDLPEGADASFFLCKELIPGYLDGITGVYGPPQGYFVDEEETEEFDKQFPPKVKEKLPGQIF